jgi:hypothetical protein
MAGSACGSSEGGQVSHVSLTNQTYTIDIKKCISDADIDEKIEEAVYELKLDYVEMIIKDDGMVHLCVTPTCPYCLMTFAYRDWLMEHIDKKRSRGHCFDS